MPERFTPEKIDRLIGILTEIRTQALVMEQRFSGAVERIAPACRPSGRNLLHYLGLRQHDLRELQRDLTALGLSSLGRSEAHVLATLDAVLVALHLIAGRPPVRPPEIAPVNEATGPALLAQNTEALLGQGSSERQVRIMVTMPSEAADHYGLVRDLLEAGMDVMRINSAHDDAAAWKGMIANLNRARRECNRPCRVMIDLCGPKLRTGQIGEGASLLHWRPHRDMRGRVVQSVMAWVTAREAPVAPEDVADVILFFDGDFACAAQPGDQMIFRDARGRKRALWVFKKAERGFWAEGRESVYVEDGTPVCLMRGDVMVCESHFGNLPRVSETVVFQIGDRFWLTGDATGSPGVRNADGTWKEVPVIPCTLPDVLEHIRTGERILFDDNTLSGVVRQVGVRGLEVEITRTKPGGEKLGADKGINLPDSALDLPALSESDLANLDFAVAHADMVGMSFLRRAEDVALLAHHLEVRGGSHLGVLLKIENRMAFENLGEILLTGLTSPPVGVMVARGDLAAEVGFERLAEVQEEILWICEAAHVPVIWATQVLEQMAKTGLPSRAEVTDAAMSARAECVMLNKGPYMVGAVCFLDDVLIRMQRHQWKKRSMLRRLSISKIGKG